MKLMKRTIKGNPTAKSLQLVEGETYTLIFTVQERASAKKVKKKKRMQLIRCYPHHAEFKDEKGIRRSFRYWDIEKLLLGEPR